MGGLEIDSPIAAALTLDAARGRRRHGNVGGPALSYAISGLPPSSAVLELAAATYAVGATAGRLRQPR